MLYYLLFPVLCNILQDDYFNELLPLQQGMLLLGRFNPNHVPEDDIREATRLSKLYVQKKIDFGYPVRCTSHYCRFMSPKTSLSIRVALNVLVHLF